MGTGPHIGCDTSHCGACTVDIDVEELLAAPGVDISYETVRCWVLKFGPRSRTRALSRRTKRMEGVEKLTVTSVDQLATFYARPSERVLRTPPEQPFPVHAVSAA